MYAVYVNSRTSQPLVEIKQNNRCRIPQEHLSGSQHIQLHVYTVEQYKGQSSTLEINRIKSVEYQRQGCLGLSTYSSTPTLKNNTRAKV